MVAAICRRLLLSLTRRRHSYRASSSPRGRTGATRMTCLARPEAFLYFSNSSGRSTCRKLKSKYHSNAVDNVKYKTQGAVWRSENHQPRAAVCYCPTLYRTMLPGTFGNQNVFQAVDEAIEHQVRDVQTAAKRALQRRHACSFRPHSKLPTAYALPKRKNRLPSGRPMLSFVDAFMRPLLEATARLLYRLCAIAFPSASAKGNVYDVLTRVRNFLQERTAETLHCRNQDLSDFFTSISAAQLQQAWNITRAFSTTTRPGHSHRFHC